jgi:hypothetical protein
MEEIKELKSHSSEEDFIDLKNFTGFEFLKNSVKEGIITNPGRADGLGEQVKNILFSIIFAKIHNIKFVYTPIKAIEHNYDNDPSFIKDIEDMLGFIHDYPIDHNGIQRSEGDDTGDLQNYFNRNIDMLSLFTEYSNVVEMIRKRHKYSDYFDNSFFNVAIHIRRPNPHDTKNYDKNYTNTLLNFQQKKYKDEFYISFLEKLYNDYYANDNNDSKNPKKSLKIHVYSQDLDQEYYNKMLSPEVKNCVVYHIYEKITITFVSMILADLLVTGASTLSYTAALIKEKNVLFLDYTPYHPPMLTKWHRYV